jgi:hypothetical protein
MGGQGLIRSLTVAILTRDNKAVLAESLKYHVPYLASIGMKLKVYDNSTHTDNSDIISKYPGLDYHKHSIDLPYDESFRYACRNTKGDYVWVLGDKLKVNMGAIPYIFDYIQRDAYCAVLVGMNCRLIAHETHQILDASKLMRMDGWHSTLCGGVIYSRALIDRVDWDRYSGHGFVHVGILFAGMLDTKLPALVCSPNLLGYGSEQGPIWLDRSLHIWSRDLRAVIDALPDYFGDADRAIFGRNVMHNGALWNEVNFIMLGNYGQFNSKVLTEYYDDIKRIAVISMDKLDEIARRYD